MKTKFTILIAYIGFACLSSASAPHADVESALGADTAQTPLIRVAATPPITSDAPEGLGPERTRRARELLANDYERNVSDLISTRWFFRKIANVTESLGNVLLYFSAAAPGVAAAITPIYPPAAPFITCSGLMCLATHVCCLGCAKCGAREEAEREQHLKDLAAEIGFHVVPLKPIITDDSTSTGPTATIGTPAVVSTGADAHLQLLPPPAALTLPTTAAH